MVFASDFASSCGRRAGASGIRGLGGGGVGICWSVVCWLVARKEEGARSVDLCACGGGYLAQQGEHAFARAILSLPGAVGREIADAFARHAGGSIFLGQRAIDGIAQRGRVDQPAYNACTRLILSFQSESLDVLALESFKSCTEAFPPTTITSMRSGWSTQAVTRNHARSRGTSKGE